MKDIEIENHIVKIKKCIKNGKYYNLVTGRCANLEYIKNKYPNYKISHKYHIAGPQKKVNNSIAIFKRYQKRTTTVIEKPYHPTESQKKWLKKHGY